MYLDEVAHYGPPHASRSRCLQIQLVSSLELEELILRAP